MQKKQHIRVSTGVIMQNTQQTIVCNGVIEQTTSDNGCRQTAVMLHIAATWEPCTSARWNVVCHIGYGGSWDDVQYLAAGQPLPVPPSMLHGVALMYPVHHCSTLPQTAFGMHPCLPVLQQVTGLLVSAQHQQCHLVRRYFSTQHLVFVDADVCPTAEEETATYERL